MGSANVGFNMDMHHPSIVMVNGGKWAGTVSLSVKPVLKVASEEVAHGSYCWWMLWFPLLMMAKLASF